MTAENHLRVADTGVERSRSTRSKVIRIFIGAAAFLGSFFVGTEVAHAGAKSQTFNGCTVQGTNWASGGSRYGATSSWGNCNGTVGVAFPGLGYLWGYSNYVQTYWNAPLSSTAHAGYDAQYGIQITFNVGCSC